MNATIRRLALFCTVCVNACVLCQKMPARKAQTLYFPRFTKIYLTETKSPCIILLLYFCFVDLVAGQTGAKLSDAKYEITSSSEGDSGSGQCLSNVFSGPVGRTLAIAGQSFTNS